VFLLPTDDGRRVLLGGSEVDAVGGTANFDHTLGGAAGRADGLTEGRTRSLGGPS